VQGLDRRAVLTGKPVVNIGSQDMDDSVWLRLARRLSEVLASSDADAALGWRSRGQASSGWPLRESGTLIE